MQPVVLGRDKRGVLAESALNDVAPSLAEEPVEYAISRPHDCLIVDLKCNPQPRHNVVLGSAVQVSRVLAREQKPAGHIELRHFWRGSGGITLRCCERRLSRGLKRL